MRSTLSGSLHGLSRRTPGDRADLLTASARSPCSSATAVCSAANISNSNTSCLLTPATSGREMLMSSSSRARSSQPSWPCRSPTFLPALFATAYMTRVFKRLGRRFRSRERDSLLKDNASADRFPESERIHEEDRLSLCWDSSLMTASAR